MGSWVVLVEDRSGRACCRQLCFCHRKSAPPYHTYDTALQCHTHWWHIFFLYHFSSASYDWKVNTVVHFSLPFCYSVLSPPARLWCVLFKAQSSSSCWLCCWWRSQRFPSTAWQPPPPSPYPPTQNLFWHLHLHTFLQYVPFTNISNFSLFP